MDVTTLIPAYKTEHIVPLFASLLYQSRPPARVIVSDDSPDGRFGEILRSDGMAAVRERLIVEIHAGPRAGAYENFKHLVGLWDRSTPLVHLLLDDDVIYPTFYARHIDVHAVGQFSCSISARWIANV